MFIAVDKGTRRIVKESTDRQEVIDFALKSSMLGGRQFVLAETFGFTKQVTESRFFESTEVSEDERADNELRTGVREGQQDEVSIPGGPFTGEYGDQRPTFLEGLGSPAGEFRDIGDIGPDEESP